MPKPAKPATGQCSSRTVNRCLELPWGLARDLTDRHTKFMNFGHNSNFEDPRDDLLLTIGPVLPGCTRKAAYQGMDNALAVGEKTVRKLISEAHTKGDLEHLPLSSKTTKLVDVESKYNKLLRKQIGKRAAASAIVTNQANGSSECATTAFERTSNGAIKMPLVNNRVLTVFPMVPVLVDFSSQISKILGPPKKNTLNDELNKALCTISKQKMAKATETDTKEEREELLQKIRLMANEQLCGAFGSVVGPKSPKRVKAEPKGKINKEECENPQVKAIPNGLLNGAVEVGVISTNSPKTDKRSKRKLKEKSHKKEKSVFKVPAPPKKSQNIKEIPEESFQEPLKLILLRNPPLPEKVETTSKAKASAQKSKAVSKEPVAVVNWKIAPEDESKPAPSVWKLPRIPKLKINLKEQCESIEEQPTEPPPKAIQMPEEPKIPKIRIILKDPRKLKIAEPSIEKMEMEQKIPEPHSQREVVVEQPQKIAESESSQEVPQSLKEETQKMKVMPMVEEKPSKKKPRYENISTAKVSMPSPQEIFQKVEVEEESQKMKVMPMVDEKPSKKKPRYENISTAKVSMPSHQEIFQKVEVEEETQKMKVMPMVDEKPSKKKPRYENISTAKVSLPSPQEIFQNGDLESSQETEVMPMLNEEPSKKEPRYENISTAKASKPNEICPNMDVKSSQETEVMDEEKPPKKPRLNASTNGSLSSSAILYENPNQVDDDVLDFFVDESYDALF